MKTINGANKMQQLILKGLGKVKVKKILNQWIKDQINEALENNYEIVFSSVIWVDEYTWKLFKIDVSENITEPFEVSDVFKFVGNKI